MWLPEILQARRRCASACMVALPILAPAQTSPPQPTSEFFELAARCAPEIHPTTLKGIVTTESGGNPYAIGVVGGHLVRQPQSLEEALATAQALKRQGFNFSLGLGQVNRFNLQRYGHTYATIFEPCENLKVGAAILKDCYLRARTQLGDEQEALRAAFSCYYAGNFTRGFRAEPGSQSSYVHNVVAHALDNAPITPVVPAVKVQVNEDPITTQRADRAIPVAGATPPSQAEGKSFRTSLWVHIVDAPTAGAVPASYSALETRPVPVRVASTPPLNPGTHAVRPNTQPERRASSESAAFVQFVN